MKSEIYYNIANTLSTIFQIVYLVSYIYTQSHTILILLFAVTVMSNIINYRHEINKLKDFYNDICDGKDKQIEHYRKLYFEEFDRRFKDVEALRSIIEKETGIEIKIEGYQNDRI